MSSDPASAPDPARDPAARHGLARLVRAFHPAPARVSAPVLLRMSAGAGLAAMVCGGLIAAMGLPGLTGWFLIAPFGASAFLVVVVPNSPLAQPWALVVGTTASALAGLAVTLVLPPSPPAAGLALGGAVALMLLLRAMHPPGGAAALIPVLSDALAPGLALLAVVLQSVLLTLFGIGWHRLTGRVYPFRQPDEAPRAAIRFGRDDLAAILDRLRLSANIGVADFARLLAAADEISAADDRVAGLRCRDAAGPMPPVLDPAAPIAAARAIMLETRAYSLPVAAPGGPLLGLLSQSDILRADAEGHEAETVASAMTRDPVTLAEEAPLRLALSALAAGGWRAVPLVDGQGHCTAMLTRADLLAVLARAPGPAKPLARQPASG